MATLEAVLEIGSTGIRLLIGQISENGTWKVIDHSELPVALGWDVFTTENVSRDTILQCVKTLSLFLEQISSWKIEKDHITVIATSAVRTAKNRDTFLDRILVKTGLKIHVIDGIEENRLMYLAVLQALHSEAPKLKESNSVILEVGGGSTEIMLLEKGQMVAVHSLRLGTVLIEQQIKATMGSQKDILRFLREYIKNAGENMNTELTLRKIDLFITIGQEVKLAAQQIGNQVSEDCWTLSTQSFFNFTDEVQKYSIEECMIKFNISYNDAKALAIGLLTYKLFIELTQAKEIIVPNTNIREGLLISKSINPQTNLKNEFSFQVIASAYNLGRKYHFDEPHATFVHDQAISIFNQMKHELGLDESARLLLEIAAILHDIGTFIRAPDHNLHSQYIILHSDIFGLSRDDMTIVAFVARYHKGLPPSLMDPDFHALSRTDRMTVQKLAAILRVADGLDRGHNQRVKKITLEFHSDTLILNLNGLHDTVLEKLAMNEKGEMFESVFGYKIILA